MAHQRLIKDTMLTMIALVIFGSTNFLFNVVVGRVFGSAYLGMVSAALSTALLFSYFVSTSFPGAVSKYVSEYLGRGEKSKADYVLSFSLFYGIVIGAISTLVAILFSNYISQIFRIPENILLLSLPLIFLYGIYMILKMAYYGYRKVGAYFKNEILADTLFFVSLGFIWIFKWNGYIYFPYLILYLFFIFKAIYFFKNHLRNRLSKYKFGSRQIFIFATISFVGTFSSMSMRSLSIMLSSKYVPANEVGYLTAAFSVTTIFFLFPNALGRVFLPEFSYIFGQKNNEKIKNLLNNSTKHITVFVTLVNSLGVIFAPWIIYIFYGNEFVSSIILLQLSLLLYWPSMVGRVVLSTLSGTKYVHIPNGISVGGLIFALSLWVFLIPKYGIVGTVIGYVIEAWIGMSFTFYFGHKYLNFDYKIILKNSIWIIIVVILITLVNNIYSYVISIVIVTTYALLQWNEIKWFLTKLKNF